MSKSDEKSKVRTCRVCGCTDEKACPGGCHWVEPDLCSKCNFKEIVNLKQYQRGIEEKIIKAVVLAFPVGAKVYFEKGLGQISAIVLSNDGERLMIRNLHTDRKYCIDAYWLLQGKLNES